MTPPVIASSEATKQSGSVQHDFGSVRGACHRPALRVDPSARNDGAVRARWLLFESVGPRARCTSPPWGEVDLRRKSDEGAPDQRGTVTPHPNPLPREREHTSVAAKLDLISSRS